MQQTAEKFEQVDQSLQKMLSNLMTELEVLQQAWRGAGGRSFEQVKRQWAQDQAALQRACGDRDRDPHRRPAVRRRRTARRPAGSPAPTAAGSSCRSRTSGRKIR